MYKPTTLSDEQKTRLAEHRAAHLRPGKSSNDNYVPDQLIWFTEDGSPEWKPGYLESKDPQPDSYWIVSEGDSRRLRRNKHDIKPRFPRIKYHPVSPSPSPVDPDPPDPPEESMSVPEPVDPPDPELVRVTPPSVTASGTSPWKKPDPLSCVAPRSRAKSPIVTRSGRETKSTRKPDFVYKMRDEQVLRTSLK